MRKLNKKGALAISQILILIVSIVAISYALGSGIGVVSADEVGQDCLVSGWDSGCPNPECQRCCLGDPNYCSTLNYYCDETTKIPGCGENGEDDTSRSSWVLSWLGNMAMGDLTRRVSSSIWPRTPQAIEGGAVAKEAATATATKFSWTMFGANAAAAAIAYAATRWLIAPALGIDDDTAKDIAEDVGWSFLLAGGGAHVLLHTAFWGTLGIGAAAAGAVLVYHLFFKKKEDVRAVIFTCYPWQADTGGNNCEECNKQGLLPCTEYQCRSLGQYCELVNKGTTEEKCVFVGRLDAEYPTIQAWQGALLGGYKYEFQNTGISPPDTGVKVIYENSDDGCVPAFTSLSFGVTLNEPATCRADIERKSSFDDMEILLSNSLIRYNHSIFLPVPGQDTLEAEDIEIKNDGNYEVFVRCEDRNKNSNTANFVFKYCTEPEKDDSPPTIMETIPASGSAIPFGKSSVNITIYLNEPSECKWDHEDKNYESMQETFDCSGADALSDADIFGLYSCETELTGLNDGVENRFYFRCKDRTEQQNTNIKSQPEEGFVLIGTRPLVISSVSPNNTIIKGSTDSIKVTLEATTSAGYDQGEAYCLYKNTEETGPYAPFSNTLSYQHSTNIWLSEEDYTYSIKCVDAGGNTDIKQIGFTVETDTLAPIVVRVYKESNNLKIITDEEASCVYDTVDCNYVFEDGLAMQSHDDTSHFTDWDKDKTFYIKCKDEYGNQPDPDKCSIVVRPFEI